MTSSNRTVMLRALMLGASALTMTVAAPMPAAAQTVTASINGDVRNADGTPVPNATISALNEATNQTITTRSGTDGHYTLAGLRPATYAISADIGGQTVTQRVQIEVGQNATLNLAPPVAAAEGQPAAAEGGEIVVTGQRLYETRTSEVGTNVSREQIENLPQNNRNFINFAALAPGIRVNQTDFRQTFSGGGIGAGRDGESFGGPQVNVFIDGVSLKSNVNQGGIVGQDVSRGNPFSQLAVGEFRVITSNYKAEYEDAGTAIITAITKSGTNEFHGELFGTFQNKDMVEKDFFQKRDNLDKPDLKRYQYGASLGGPIIKDKLFFFGAYEANIQDRSLNVVPGDPGASASQIPFDVNDFAGSFASPFREHLGFGKINWEVADNQTVELSGSIRKETDRRDFGGQASVERASAVDNDVYTAKLSHTYRGDRLLNEATIDFLKSDLSFGADFSEGFGLTYQGVIQVGGRADFQEVGQRGLTFRDNVTLGNMEWNGNHTVKFGAKLSFQKYSVGGSGPNANPQFEFVRDNRGTADPSDDLDFSIPSVVRFGGGDPNVSAKTTQVGLFVQDDWEVNDKLLINLGLRWDYDSNEKNNDFETPQSAVEALLALGADPRIQPAFFDVEDYISTGSNRDADLNHFAPRIGFSYDWNADQRTVVFGGYGRYYDRALFRSAAEESLLSQFRSGELLFSDDGLPRDGRPTILFQPQYLTPEGFQALLDSLAADPTSPGTSELRVIPNDLKTPYTDQFSFGIRQRVGIFRTSLTFNHTVGKHQIGYSPLNRSAATNASGFFDFIPLINGYSNVVAAFNERTSKFDAIYLTVDKPYTKESGWGAGLAYTGVIRSDQRGFEFNFDKPDIGEQPMVPNAGDEKHHVVINGLVDLPWGFRASTLITYGSGAPFFVIDANDGFQPDLIKLGFFNHLPHFLQVDLRLQKIFKVFGDKEFTLSGEVFNLFDRANFGAADGFTCCGGNANFGKPNGLAGPPRTFQVGAAFRF